MAHMPPKAPIPKTQLPAPKKGETPKRIGPRKGYADGGKVAARTPAKPAPAPRPKTRDTIASPKPASTADALRNQRRRQEQALGLANGGAVVRKYADGGKVSKKMRWPTGSYKPHAPMPTPDSLRGRGRHR